MGRRLPPPAFRQYTRRWKPARRLCQTEPLLHRRRRRLLLEFTTLIPQHGGNKLPRRAGRVPPRSRYPHDAICLRAWIEVKEPGVAAYQSFPFGGGSESGLDQAAFGRNFADLEKTGGRHEIELVGIAQPDAAL